MIQSILIDQREPDRIQQLSFDGAPTVVTLLEYGDLHVLCEDGVLLVIERKTPDDLLNTLGDKEERNRLFRQCASLLSMEGWPYLVIDGNFQRGPDGKVCTDGRSTGWTWSALQGALVTIQELGVMIVYSGGDFEKTVLWLANHKRLNTVRIAPRRKAIFASPTEQVIASLPGFDDTKAAALIAAHAGNLTWALCSLLDPEWEKIDGIGPKTKSNLRQLFSLADNEILWPFYRDENHNDKPKEKTS